MGPTELSEEQKKKGDHLNLRDDRPSGLEVKGGWGLKPLIQRAGFKKS